MPFYIDAPANSEMEFFDIQKSEVAETCSYFEKGVLMLQVNNLRTVAQPNAASFTKLEEERLEAELKVLQLLLKRPK